MADFKVLKLTKHYGNLFAGEVASFPNDVADHIVKHGGGEVITPEAAKDAAKKPAAPAK